LRTLAERGPEVHVRDAMRRDFQVADSHDMLEHALALLRSSNSRSIPVEREGSLVGILDMENVSEFLMIQSALRRSRQVEEAKTRPATIP
jgi:CBS-domain-containing membrane protein